jgi:hypothetical protein
MTSASDRIVSLDPEQVTVARPVGTNAAVTALTGRVSVPTGVLIRTLPELRRTSKP